MPEPTYDRIELALSALEAAYDNFVTQANAYAAADHEFDRARSLALLDIEAEAQEAGKKLTVDMREARVFLRCEVLQLRARLAKVNEEAARALLGNRKIELDALRTLESSERSLNR